MPDNLDIAIAFLIVVIVSAAIVAIDYTDGN